MFRPYFITLLLALSLMAQGCSAFKYFDNSSEEEIRKHKMSKDEIWRERQGLERQNANLQRQMSAVRRENEDLKGQVSASRREKENLRRQINIARKETPGNNPEVQTWMAKMKAQNEYLFTQLNKTKEENQRIRNENRLLASKPGKSPRPTEDLSAQSHPSQKNIRGIKIKVLSGDGNLDSAREMAKKLRKIGYMIKTIHSSQRKFSRNTIFFAPEFQNEARSLAPSLGGTPVLKPLTWSTIFDLIVVTGIKK